MTIATMIACIVAVAAMPRPAIAERMSAEPVNAQPVNAQPADAQPGSARPGPITVTDDRGATHTFTGPAWRIVTLLPSLTETVCAVAGCDRLVGVDTFSNFPPEVGRLPRLGGLTDVSVEAVVRLQPDVILAARHSMTTARFEALGLPVLEFDPQTHGDVASVVGRIGALTDRAEQAARLQQRMTADMREAAARLKPALRGQSVYVEIGAGPYAAGARSFIGETLDRLGLSNVIDASMGPWPRINPEVVLRAQPDWIVAPDSLRGAIGRRPGTTRLGAWPGHACLFPPATADVFVRPGPRLADGAAWLVDCLNRADP